MIERTTGGSGEISVIDHDDITHLMQPDRYPNRRKSKQQANEFAFGEAPVDVSIHFMGISDQW